MSVSDEIDEIVKARGISTTIPDFSILLQDTITQTKQALEERKLGIAGDGNVQELELIYNELLKIDGQIKSNQIPPTEERDLISARLVTDSWPIESKLGDDICRISFLYKHTLNG